MVYRSVKKTTEMFPKNFCIACGEQTYKNGGCSNCGYVGG